VSSKDASIVRGTVIGGVRSRFSRDEVRLKIVDASVRGSRAAVNIVYMGRATKAEVAAAAAQTIATSIPRSYRLRKLSYVRITVSKTGSSRGTRFLMNLRVPRIVYSYLLPRTIDSLRRLGASIRLWRVVDSGEGVVRVKVYASYGLPEIDVRVLDEKIKGVIEGMRQVSKRVCIDVDLRTRTSRILRSLCTPPTL